MWKKIILILLIITSYILICHKIYSTYKITNPEKIVTKLTEKSIIPIKKEQPIGKLIIKKINLSEELYSINSPKNNIEEHVTILKQSEEPTQKDSSIFIAAHSGTGKIAYFKDLNKLKINDHIILVYKNITYTYIVKNIWEDKKDGTITIPKEQTNQLILTTCSPTKKDYQLIVNCILLQ